MQQLSRLRIVFCLRRSLVKIKIVFFSWSVSKNRRTQIVFENLPLLLLNRTKGDKVASADASKLLLQSFPVINFCIGKHEHRVCRQRCFSGWDATTRNHPHRKRDPYQDGCYGSRIEVLQFCRGHWIPFGYLLCLQLVLSSPSFFDFWISGGIS